MPKATPKPPNRERVQIGFGEALRRLRMERGLTQEGLAAAADLHFTYVSSVERGERNLSLFNICRLAWALNVAPSALMKAAE